MVTFVLKFTSTTAHPPKISISSPAQIKKFTTCVQWPIHVLAAYPAQNPNLPRRACGGKPVGGGGQLLRGPAAPGAGVPAQLPGEHLSQSSRQPSPSQQN